MANSPFIYGRPVYMDEFVNRDKELETLFDRLRNGEATSIVGEPHIGKTSLMLRLMQPEIRAKYLANLNSNFVFSYIDLHPIDENYTHEKFWAEALQPLLENPGVGAIREQTEKAIHTKQNRTELRNLVRLLVSNERTLVLLLDEFERILKHPNFQDASFFSLLRSLASSNKGFTYVTASRLSIKSMNDLGRNLIDVGSPLFNISIELRLSPFESEHIATIFRKAGSMLADEDQYFAQRICGGNPFLLQAFAAALCELPTQNRYEKAAELFYDRISSHFDDLWDTMDDRTRTTAVILSLIELGGRALGKSYAFGEIEDAERFGPELDKLRRLGLAIKVGEGWRFDRKHLLLWRGSEWTISSQAFVWWIRNVVIADTRKVSLYSDWLQGKQYLIFLTQKQWDKLLALVRTMPEWAVSSITGLAQAVVREMLEKKAK